MSDPLRDWLVRTSNDRRYAVAAAASAELPVISDFLQASASLLSGSSHMSFKLVSADYVQSLSVAGQTVVQHFVTADRERLSS